MSEGGARSEVSARGPRAAALLADGAGLLLAVPLWLWWAIWRGGFAATVFPLGLLYLALAALLLAYVLPVERPRGSRAAALVALAGLATWGAISLIWADDRGAALVGAERLLLMLLSFALPLLWPPARAALRLAIAALPLVALAGGLAGLMGAIARTGSLLDGRLVGPTGYANASGALFMIGAVPALIMASRREHPPLLRVAMLAAAGPLAALALLTQSRGVIVATIVTATFVFVLVPNRLRLALATALVAAPVALASGALLGVRLGAQQQRASDALDHAALAIALVFLALVALGAIFVAADRRFELSARATSRITLAGRVSIVLALVAGVCLFGATQGDPVSWAQARWTDFKAPDYHRLESAHDRFGGGLGSNRYDYWRVAVDLAAARPVTGVGVENFAAPYLERRHTQKAPLYAHSLWFGALAELGLPGLLLLVGFIGAAAVAPVRRLRRAAASERTLIIAAAAPAVYLLVHGSADWLHVFPALTVPALGLVAAAGSPHAGRRPSSDVVRRRVAIGSASVAAVVALVVTAPLFVSARLVERAAASAGRSPAGALRDLRTAADVDPLSATPLLEQGVIALRLGQLDSARAAFGRAAARDRSNWFPTFAIAAIDARLGARAAAARSIAEAHRRDPRDPVLDRTRTEIAAGRRPDPLALVSQALTEGG